MISSFLSVDKVSFITVLFLLSLIGNQSAEPLAGLQSKREQISSKDLAAMIERNAIVTSNAFSIVLKTSIILMLIKLLRRVHYSLHLILVCFLYKRTLFLRLYKIDKNLKNYKKRLLSEKKLMRP